MFARVHPISSSFRTLMLGCGVAGCISAWADAPRFTDVRQREIWVPEKSLPHILAENPKAVVLTPEEYKTLIKEAGTPIAPELITPPSAILLRSTQYRGRLMGEMVLTEATYTFECLATDLQQWQTLQLPMPLASMSNVKLDDQSALRVLPAADPAQPSTDCAILVRTPGLHTLTASFFLPVASANQQSSLSLPNPGSAAGHFILELPQRYELLTDFPVSTSAAANGVLEHTLPIPAKLNPFQLQWRSRDIAPLAGGAVLQTCSYLYHIDPVRITSDLGIVLSSALARVPQELQIPLPPAVRVLSLDGPDVLDWALVENFLTIRCTSANLHETSLRLVLETTPNAVEGGTDLVTTLPQPSVNGLHRASGSFAIVASPEVRVRHVATSGLNVQTTAALPGYAATQPGFVVGFAFPQLSDPPVVTYQPLKPRFQADQLTHIQLRRDAIEVIRTLRILVKEGQIFTTSITLPTGEETLRVTLEDGTEAPWKMRPDGTMEITWPTAITTKIPGAVTVTTRLDPEGWFTLGDTPRPLKFSSAKIDGPELTTGYVGLDFDDRFHVSTSTITGLEPTDPTRLAANGIPLTGRMMWSRAEDFTLAMGVSRRPSEVHANITAYALPLLHTCEVEGQIDFDVRNSGVRQILITAPPGVAESLRFDSPLIAERKLEPLTGEWTITFHEELAGRPSLRFHWSLPLGETKAADNPASTAGQRFAMTLPVLKLPEAGRTTGTWIIEANTDTELSITAQGLDDRDALSLPGISNYTPQHRVIAAYSWRGSAWKLALEGTRHPTAPLPGLVIDNLSIHSVLSADGTQRHQLNFEMRSNGEQFFTCPLPQTANILSLEMDDVALKPVADPVLRTKNQNGLRVQLPATIDARQMRIKLTYELPSQPWDTSGSLELTPILLPPHLPVLNSRWDVRVPDGYSYSDFESTLEPDFKKVQPTLASVMVERMPDLNRYEWVSSKQRNAEVYSNGNADADSDFNGVEFHKSSIDEADPYEERSKQTARDRAESAINMLAMEMEDQRKQVDAKRIEMIRLMKQYEIIDFSGLSGWIGAENSVANSDQATYTQARQHQEDFRREVQNLELQLKALLEIKDQDKLTEYAGTLNIEGMSIRDSLSKYRALQLQVPFLKDGGLGDDHPKVVAARSQVETMSKQLSRAVESFKDTIQTRIDVAKASLKALEDSTQENEKKLVGDKTRYPEYLKAKKEYEQQFHLLQQMQEHNLKQMVDLEMPMTPFERPKKDAQIRRELTISPESTVNSPAAPNGLGFPVQPVATGGFGDGGKISGLIPLNISLPESGRTFSFRGQAMPGPLKLRYTSWQRDLHLGWLWLLAGAAAAGLVAARRPIFFGVLMALPLHFLPNILGPSWQRPCNALLLGWLVVCGILFIRQRLLRRCS